MRAYQAKGTRSVVSQVECADEYHSRAGSTNIDIAMR